MNLHCNILKIPDQIDIFQVYQRVDPEDDFVISKKPNGSVLSRYGDNVWILWPYATVPKKPPPLIFSGFCDKIKADVKWLMFILIYMTNTGRANTLSPGTLTRYMSVLKKTRFLF